MRAIEENEDMTLAIKANGNGNNGNAGIANKHTTADTSPSHVGEGDEEDQTEFNVQSIRGDDAVDGMMDRQITEEEKIYLHRLLQNHGKSMRHLYGICLIRTIGAERIIELGEASTHGGEGEGQGQGQESSGAETNRALLLQKRASVRRHSQVSSSLLLLPLPPPSSSSLFLLPLNPPSLSLLPLTPPSYSPPYQSTYIPNNHCSYGQGLK